MDGRIGKRDPLLLGQPPLDVDVAAEAFRGVETGFQGLDRLGRNRLLARLGPWGSQLAELFGAALLVAL